MDPTIGARFTLLKRIFHLAQEQRTALETDRFQRFEALLDERQRVIEELVQEAGGDLEHPENVILFPGALPSADDDLAVTTVLNGILALDRDNEVLLRQKTEELARSLRELARGRHVTRGYRVGEASGPYGNEIRHGGYDRAG